MFRSFVRHTDHVWQFPFYALHNAALAVGTNPPEKSSKRRQEGSENVDILFGVTQLDYFFRKCFAWVLFGWRRKRHDTVVHCRPLKRNLVVEVLLGVTVRTGCDELYNVRLRHADWLDAADTVLVGVLSGVVALDLDRNSALLMTENRKVGDCFGDAAGDSNVLELAASDTHGVGIFVTDDDEIENTTASVFAAPNLPLQIYTLALAAFECLNFGIEDAGDVLPGRDRFA
jgi:hypothetical protein